MINQKKKTTRILIIAIVAIILIATITISTNPGQAFVKRHNQPPVNSSSPNNSTNSTLTDSVTPPNVKILG